jgi:hypothetical protein
MLALLDVCTVEGCLFWPANAPARKAGSRGDYQFGTRIDPSIIEIRTILSQIHINHVTRC